MNDILNELKQIIPCDWIVNLNQSNDPDQDSGFDLIHPDVPSKKLDVVINERWIGVFVMPLIDDPVEVDFSGPDYNFEVSNDSEWKDFFVNYVRTGRFPS